MRLKRWGLFALLLMLVAPAAEAEVIRFPDDELAAESVLPVFDNPEAVKNRNVVTQKRVELGSYLGYNLTEPFFNPLNLGASATYHLSEHSAVNIFGTYFMSGVSSNTEALNSPDLSTQPVNLQLAPRAEWLLLANYQYTGFYGKFSLTKDYTMNLSLYGLGGIGGIYIGDKVFPVASVGLGQKFYFTPNLALRFDLRFLFYQGPNIVSGPVITGTEEKPTSYFDKKFIVGSLLTTGLVWLIPNS